MAKAGCIVLIHIIALFVVNIYSSNDWALITGNACNNALVRTQLGFVW